MVDWIKSSVSRSTAAVASSKTKTWSSLWSLVHQIHLPLFSWGELLRGRLTASGQHSDSHLPRAPHATAHVFKCVDKCYFQVLAVRFDGIIIWPSLGWSFFLPRRPIIYEKTTWRPEGRPDTKSERWDWRREDQTAASLQIYDCSRISHRFHHLYCSNGSRLCLRVPENSTGSCPIDFDKRKRFEEVICFHLRYDGQPTPQPVQAQLRDIYSVNENPATSRLYQPFKENSNFNKVCR